MFIFFFVCDFLQCVVRTFCYCLIMDLSFLGYAGHKIVHRLNWVQHAFQSQYNNIPPCYNRQTNSRKTPRIQQIKSRQLADHPIKASIKRSNSEHSSSKRCSSPWPLSHPCLSSRSQRFAVHQIDWGLGLPSGPLQVPNLISTPVLAFVVQLLLAVSNSVGSAHSLVLYYHDRPSWSGLQITNYRIFNTSVHTHTVLFYKTKCMIMKNYRV